MIAYNLMYFIVWSLSLISLDKRVDVKFAFRLQVLILVLFTALRFQTGYDWPVYERFYNTQGTDVGPSLEIGYVLTAKLFYSVGLSFNIFVFCYTTIQLILIASVIRYFFPGYCVVILAIMFSISDFYLIPMFSLMRQGMAVSLFLYGLMHYFKGNKFKAIVFLGLSASFHLSVLPMILFSFILIKLRLSIKTTTVIFFVFLLSYLTTFDPITYIIKLVLPYIGSKYSVYIDLDTYNATVVYRVIFSVISLVLFVLINKSTIHFDNNSTIQFQFAAFAVIFPLMFFAFPTISTRYQYFYAIFLIGVSLKGLTFIKKDSLIFVLIVLIGVFYIIFIRFLNAPLSVVYVPYQDMITYDQYNSTGGERTEKLMAELYQLWNKK